MSNKLALSFELTADPAKLKAGLAVARRDILSTYADLKRGVDDANKSLEAAQVKAQEMGRNLAQVGQPTRAMVAEFDKARAAVLAAKSAVESKTQALQRQRGLAQANAQAIVAATRAEQQASVSAAATVAAAQQAAHQRRMSGLAQEIAAAKAAAAAQTSAAALVVAAQTAAHQRRMADLVQEIAAAKAAAAAQQSRALMLVPMRGAGPAREMSAITPAAAAAATAVARVESNLGRVAAAGATLAPVAGQLSRLQAGVLAIAATGIGVSSLGGLSRVSDGYAALDSRVKLVSTSFDDFKSAQEGVYRISLQNGQAAEANASFYGSIARAVRNMGRETGDALGVTEGLANSLKISRAGQQESASATLQFAQALRSGVLRGDEFNTVMEAAPRLAQALADGLRVPQDRLRQLAEDGKLTSAAIVEALLSQSAALKREADSMTLTIGQASTNMSTAFQRAFGERTANNAAALAGGINLLAGNMNTLVDIAAVAGAGLAVAFGARLVAAIFAAVSAKQALLATERETAAAALTAAQANLRAAQAEAARTLTTRNLAAAQLQLAAAEKASTAAAAGSAARVGAGLVGALGGPLGLVTTLLTVGVTAWSLWGNRAEAATVQAGKSLAELVKEIQDFGANMSVAEKTKQYEALAVAIAKAREEEIRLRQEARQRTLDEGAFNGIVTAAGVEASIDFDPAVSAKVAERRQAEQFLQDEITKIADKATDERAFLVRALVEKQKALNGELVIDEKKSLEARVKDNKSAADAVRDAWLKSLDEIKAKRADAEAAPGKAADRAASLGGRIDQVRMSGMSEQQRAAEQARQARAAQEGAAANRTRGSFELTKGYSQQLAGDLDKAKASFNAAEKDLERAFALAEKAGDAGMMDEIAARLVDIEKQRGVIAGAEAKQLETQAEGQRQKMLELDGAAEALKNKLAGMEVDVKIDAAIANIQVLQAEAAKLQAMLAGSAGAAGVKPAAADAAIPGRAFGGPLPGWAPHDRADNMIYRGTPGEWVIQRPAVRYWGRDFISAINAMRMPNFAFGGELGGSSMVSRLRVPSISASAGGGQRNPDVFDFGPLGKVRARSTSSTASDVEAVLKRAALRFGRD